MRHFNLKKTVSPLLLSTLAFFAGISLLALGCKTVPKAISTNQPANTLLYKIEGNDIKTSYVYGTIHVLPAKDFNLKDKVKTAFEASEQIALELDMDDPAMMVEMMQNVMMEGDTTLDKLMDPEHYEELDSMLTSSIGVGAAVFNKMKPFMVSSQLLISFIGEQPASFEGTFLKMAAISGQEILGLEKVKDQLDMFDKVPYQDQADDIVEMLDDPDATADLFDELVETYKKEDISAMYEMMHTYFNGDDDTMDLMLHQRNKNWIPRITELATAKSTFIGVGAGHLGGEQGVIALLKEAGYTVTPIMD